MMRNFRRVFLVLGVLLFSFVFSGCDSTDDILGTYSSSNNGTIEITYFDGTDGEYVASGLVLSRLNNGNSYTTQSGDVELFTIYRKTGDVYSFRTSIDGVAFIGTFNSDTYILTVEGINYSVN